VRLCKTSIHFKLLNVHCKYIVTNTVSQLTLKPLQSYHHYDIVCMYDKCATVDDSVAWILWTTVVFEEVLRMKSACSKTPHSPVISHCRPSIFDLGIEMAQLK